MLLQFLAIILLVNCSRGFHENYYWDWSQGEQNGVEANAGRVSNIGAHPSPLSIEWSSQESTPTYCTNVYRAANLKDSDIPPICPPDESFLSKKDIITMINYIENNMNVVNNINDTYYPVAVEVRNKLVHAFEEIQKRVETRPEHVENILQDIDATQKKLEPIVDQLVLKLQDFKTYEKSFENVNDRAEDDLRNLKKYIQLCQFNNCDERTIVLRQNNNPNKFAFKTATDEDNYCTSLKDFHQNIVSNLTNFQQDYQQIKMNKIKEDDTTYAAMISDIRFKVKEGALSMFGTSMYNILSLQDDYHNYANELSTNIDINAEFNMIRKNTLKVEYKMMELTEGVAKYHQYCLNCKPKQMRRMSSIWDLFNSKPKQLPKELETTTRLEEPNKSVQILEAHPLNIDNLIKATIEGYKQVIDDDYTKIFEELSNTLNDPNLIQTYIVKLKPIEENVKNKVMKRQEVLLNMKSKLSQSAIKQVYELSMKSKMLLDNVQSAIDFVNMYV